MGKHITCYISDDKLLADLLNEAVGLGVSKSSIIQSALEAHMHGDGLAIKDKQILDTIDAKRGDMSRHDFVVWALAMYLMTTANA
jgi:hypothetical protein